VPRLKTNLSPCSAARSLEVLGDRWTLLIIREAIFGTRRFDKFARHLGIARNVLTARLASLIEADILMQVPLRDDAPRMGYKLTEKGEDLFAVLIALMQWGDRWLQTAESVPIRILERASGALLGPVVPRSRSGKALRARDLDWAAGPGAHDPRIAPLVAAYHRQRRSGSPSIGTARLSRKPKT
jgi:DNA-binding HxlR family transcriptional regulator